MFLAYQEEGMITNSSFRESIIGILGYLTKLKKNVAIYK